MYFLQSNQPLRELLLMKICPCSMQWLNRWVSNTDHCHSEAVIGTFFLPTSSAPGMIGNPPVLRSHSIMAKPLEIKVWSKQEHSLQQHYGRSSQGGIQCNRGENKCLCSDSWKSKIKASKPCEFVLGKRVEQLQHNPGKNHPLFLMLLHSCHHEKLHRLKWRKRTTHHWAVLICCWMLTRWQRGKYEIGNESFKTEWIQM